MFDEPAFFLSPGEVFGGELTGTDGTVAGKEMDKSPALVEEFYKLILAKQGVRYQRSIQQRRECGCNGPKVAESKGDLAVRTMFEVGAFMEMAVAVAGQESRRVFPVSD